MHGRQGADAVDAYSEAHHIELELGEALDAGGVEDVPHRLVAQGLSQLGGILPEHLYLRKSELILLRILRNCQMREGRLHTHGRAALEILEQRRQFACHEP